MDFVCSDSLKLTSDQVAIALTFGAFGRHAGLVFSGDGGFKIVHMRFHLNIGLDPFPTISSPCWIATPLKMQSTNAKILIGHLNRIGSTSPKIPFGINIQASKGSFTNKGDYVKPDGSDGLTCATFVNELCRAVGLPLVDEKSWDEDREDDRLWAEEVAGLLVEKNADPAHIAWVRGKANGLRIRPEEVAVAGNYKTTKNGIDYQIAKAESALILQKLGNCCPDAAPRLSDIAKAIKKLLAPPTIVTLH